MLHQSIEIPAMYHCMMFESNIPLYSYCLCPQGDEIVKFAALAAPPVEEEMENKPSPKKLAKSIALKTVQVYGFLDSNQDITIGPLQWEVGDITLDSEGLRLLVVSCDGMYINIFCTLAQGESLESAIIHPIQTFCRGSSPCRLGMPVRIFSASH